MLFNQPVVIDNGSGTLKAGFAGEERPKVYAPAMVGRPKYQRVMTGALEQDTYIGSAAQQHRGLLRLTHPMEHGVVTNWNDMELVWAHALKNELQVATEEHPVLVTEAPLNPRANRDRMAQLMFETFGVPALYVLLQAVLALYASGRTTGVVLDVGDGVSHAVPVYEGFSLSSAVRRVDLAGRDVTEQLQLLMRKSGVLLQTSAEKDIAREVKEQLCHVAKDPVKAEKEWETLRYMPSSVGTELAVFADYRLPDGHSIRVGAERFRAPEILFAPHLVGLEQLPVHMALQEAIQKVDLDLRPALYQSVVLSGGTTLTRGFGDRLLGELRAGAAAGTKIKIYAPPERRFSTWIGGLIVAGLLTFKRMWVEAAEYHENPELIHTRCL